MSFISHLHTDILRARTTRRGASGGSLDTTEHKSYPRMPQVPLPKSSTIAASLSEVFATKTDHKKTRTERPISLETWGTILGTAVGAKRQSIGNRSLLETYLITSSPAEHAPSVFHYDPTSHALETLTPLPHDMVVNDLTRGPAPFEPSALIVVTGVWERSRAASGDYGYLLTLLSAGTISEDMVLVASALGCGAQRLDGFDAVAITALLDLDPDDEQPIAAIALTAYA